MSEVPILMYHAVGHGAGPRFRHLEMAPAELDRQCRWLAGTGFTGVSLGSLLAHLDRRRDCSRMVGLTFDDGFEDFAGTVVPILVRHGFAATTFIPSGLIGGRASWLDAEGEGGRRVMGRGELAEVLAAGMEVGAHGSRHVELDTLSDVELSDEVHRSRAELEDATGQVPQSFCYPFGYQSARVRRVVKAAGFVGACAIRYRRWDVSGDRMAIPRLMARSIGSEDLSALLGPSPGDAVVSVIKRAGELPWRGVRRGRRIVARPRL